MAATSSGLKVWSRSSRAQVMVPREMSGKS